MSRFRFVPVEELTGTPPLIVGLSGMSDSGKTYSALRMARAIVQRRGGEVMLADTEGRAKKYRRADQYPELHPFRVLEWQPPYDGDSAVELCQVAIKAGAGCILIDSASDEWEGDGGVLQSQESELARLAGGWCRMAVSRSTRPVAARGATAWRSGFRSPGRPRSPWPRRPRSPSRRGSRRRRASSPIRRWRRRMSLTCGR